MQTYIIYIWDKLRGSYWFLPALFGLFAIVLGILLPMYEAEFLVLFPDDLPQWLETTNDAARATLSLITGTMFTVAGTVFSISVVTLSLTSQQFGPRLLRSFMTDVTTQFTLGLLIAAAIYALLVLRVVEDHSPTTDYSPPHLSLLFAIVFTIASAATLIFFIHRITVLIQAPNVIETLARELDESLDRLVPEKSSKKSTSDNCEDFSEDLELLFETRSDKEGYIQAIEFENLVKIAKKYEARFKVLRRPGHFIQCGDAFVAVHGNDSFDEEQKNSLTRKINRCLLVGNRRTPRQDLECAVDELVEIAIRALSPGVNDTFSALSCIDRLGGFLRRFVARPLPLRTHQDSKETTYVQAV